MTTLADAVYGCLIAGAIGDALGAPVEGWHYRDIAAQYGRMDCLAAYDLEYAEGNPGAATDDTVLRYYACQAIIRRQGRVLPEDIAHVWLERMNADRLWTSEKIVLLKLREGIDPWLCGRGGLGNAGALMFIAAIGIINAGDPRQAFQDAMCVASINCDERPREFAAAIAAAHAAAFCPGATPQSIVDAMFEYGSDYVKRSLTLALELLEPGGGVAGFRERFYDKLLDWSWPRPVGQWRPDRFFCATGREKVPVVAALLLLCEGDVNECLVEGASFGRDADSIASLAGGLAGILQGASAVRPEWIRRCEDANRDFFREASGSAEHDFGWMAEQLVVAIGADSERLKRRAGELEALLRRG